MSVITDLAGVLSENRTDIVDMSQELENVFKDGLSYLRENIGSMKESIMGMFDQLDVSALDFTPMKNQLDSMSKAIKDSVGIDLSAPIDLPDVPDMSWVIKNIKKNLPKLPGVDMSKLEEILDTLAKGDFSIELKDLQNTVQGNDSNTGSNDSSGGTPDGIKSDDPNTGSSDSLGSALDDIFSSIQDDIDEILEEQRENIEAIYNQLTQEITDETIAEIQDAFQDIINLIASGENLSMQSMMGEVLEAMKDIAGTAVAKVKNLIPIIFDNLDNLIDIIEKLIYKEMPDSEITDLYKMISGNDNPPKLSTLFCLPAALPFALISKGITGEKPSFSGLFQDSEWLKIAYGAMQIVDGILMFLDGLLPYCRSFSNQRMFNISKRLDFISGLINMVAQLSGQPFEENDGLLIGIWGYQWFVCFLWPFLDALLSSRHARKVQHLDNVENGNYPSKRDRDIEVYDYFLNAWEFTFEIAHFILFMVQFGREIHEDGDSDGRLQACYFIDPLTVITGFCYESCAADVSYRKLKDEFRLIKGIVMLLLQLAYGSLYLAAGFDPPT